MLNSSSVPQAVSFVDGEREWGILLAAAIVQNWFDVHYRSAIDRFQVIHSQSIMILDCEHLYPVQSDRVRPVGGARRENTGERVSGIVARMNLQDFSLCLMQPRENQNFRPWFDSAERLDKALVDYEPCFGRVMEWLPRRILPAAQR